MIRFGEKMINKRSKIALLFLLAVMMVLVAALSSCGDDEISEIYIAKGDMFKAVYVEGQELDLGGAALTVVIDGESSIVPLDSEDVSITGYDKTKVGKQTLTITYAEKTTTAEVSVIARMSPEGYESNYFTNEEFDKTKGRIRIARDDATTFTVQMNDPDVKIVSFDSSLAGDTKVGVKYVDSKGTAYEGSFTVRVHEVGEVKLTAPTKKSYKSHETELNLNGGYLTVRSNDSSGFEKKILLTADTVKLTGFDPSVSNLGNRDTAQSQDITVDFKGNISTFTIKISFSGVSLAKETAKLLTSINWDTESFEDIVISDELGEAAAEAIAEFLDLSPADKANLSEEETLALVRAAAVYVNRAYMEELEKMSDAIVLTNVNMFVTGKSYEDVESAVARLSDEDDILNVYAGILRELREQYADTILYKTATLANYIMVHTEDAGTFMVKVLKHMLRTYDYISDIPDNWTAESLSAHGASIDDMFKHIAYGDFSGVNYFGYYDIVSSWRTNDDMSEIVYSYYLYTVDTVDTEKLYDCWTNIPMPDAMGEWYMAMYNAVYQEQLMSQNIENPNALLYDVTNFMYYYNELIEACELVKTTGSQLSRDLYDELGCDLQVEIYVRRAACGYIYHMNYALGLPAVIDVWDKYINIISTYSESGDIASEAFGEDVEELFASIFALSPSELNAFLTSLHFRYDSVYGKVYVLDCKSEAISVLTTLLKAHYVSGMTENAGSVFYDLLVAMESYSLYYADATDYSSFEDKMGKLVTAYGTLAGDDKASFDGYMGAYYEKLLSIYNNIQNDSAAATDDQAALIEKLIGAVTDFDRILAFILGSDDDITEEEQNRINAAFPVLFALYEKASDIYSRLDSDAAIGNLLVAKEYEYSGAKITVDRLYYNVRKIFVSLMLNATLTGEDGNPRLAWDAYIDSGLAVFFRDAADLMLAGFDGVTYTGTGVTELLDAYHAFDKEKKNYFLEFAAYVSFYDGIELYFEAALGEELAATEVVEAILSAEARYIVLEVKESDEAKASFIEYMDKAIEKYTALANADALPDELAEIYDTCLDAYNLLKT